MQYKKPSIRNKRKEATWFEYQAASLSGPVTERQGSVFKSSFTISHCETMLSNNYHVAAQSISFVMASICPSSVSLLNQLETNVDPHYCTHNGKVVSLTCG
jgi:hypothetical protein